MRNLKALHGFAPFAKHKHRYQCLGCLDKQFHLWCYTSLYRSIQICQADCATLCRRTERLQNRRLSFESEEVSRILFCIAWNVSNDPVSNPLLCQAPCMFFSLFCKAGRLTKNCRAEPRCESPGVCIRDTNSPRRNKICLQASGHVSVCVHDAVQHLLLFEHVLKTS